MDFERAKPLVAGVPCWQHVAARAGLALALESGVDVAN